MEDHRFVCVALMSALDEGSLGSPVREGRRIAAFVVLRSLSVVAPAVIGESGLCLLKLSVLVVKEEILWRSAGR